MWWFQLLPCNWEVPNRISEEIFGLLNDLNVIDLCVTMHYQYNDVSNQQDATTFSFINLFNSALRVSDDKFPHPQELFLTVYTAFGTTHRLVPRLRWNVVVYTVKKSS